MGKKRSHRRTWWWGWKTRRSFTSSSISVTRSWSLRNPTPVIGVDSSGGEWHFRFCVNIVEWLFQYSTTRVILPIPPFQDQRRICGAVHCEGGDEVCPALLLWGRDRTSQAQVWSGGWVSLEWPHLGSLKCFDHLIDQVGSGLPEVLLQGSGDQERALCQRCLQGEQRGVFYFWRICEKHLFQKIRADILASVSWICISTL